MRGSKTKLASAPPRTNLRSDVVLVVPKENVAREVLTAKLSEESSPNKRGLGSCPSLNATGLRVCLSDLE